MMHKAERLCMLMILDGWGISPVPEGNAVLAARTPCLDRLWEEYPHTRLRCSGGAVGLPEGIMGNSEVGHLNIGAGRIVYQDLMRIDMAVRDGSLFRNETLISVMEKVKNNCSALHLMGLVSDGGVHSQLNHLLALLDMARQQGVEKVYVHAILDGRDTVPTDGIRYVQQLRDHMQKHNFGSIASVCGRFYAMDRDKRWDRIEKAYRLYTAGEGIAERDPVQAVQHAYDRGETDEFVKPAVLQKQDGKPLGTVRDRDGLIFFNFRADRAREITQAFTDADFDFFPRESFPQTCEYVTMTRYDEHFALPAAFAPVHLEDILGETVSRKGLRQLRIAETEKYAHVTYFFNGGEEKPFPLEDRCLIPSPRDVPTYDHKPEMSALEVTEEVLRRIHSGDYRLIVLNFANMDMVGHTGIMEAAVKACETVDRCVGKIVTEVLTGDGAVCITADHGNAEKMLDDKGNPHTAHTLNPVRFILADKQRKHTRLREGILADIAPTLLELMGIEKPELMTGSSLTENKLAEHKEKQDMLTDFITGKEIPDAGSEANRQAVERLLIEKKGFAKEDIEVDVPIEFRISGETYCSKLDLVLRIGGRRFMVIKCAAGSLGSREREVLSAARLLDTFQIPLAAVSDGKTALLFDTLSGKQIGEGLDALPAKEEAANQIQGSPVFPLPDKRCEKEKLIFRSYDSMNVNR